MTTTARPASSATRIHADHTVLKHLGRWTDSHSFHVRSRKSTVILDLRATRSDELELLLELDGSKLTLLVADDAAVEHWDLRFAGRGRVKDDQAPAGAASVRLHGRAANSRVVVRRGAVAELASIASVARLREIHHVHQLAGRGRAGGGRGTIAGPARLFFGRPAVFIRDRLTRCEETHVRDATVLPPLSARSRRSGHVRGGGRRVARLAERGGRRRRPGAAPDR